MILITKSIVELLRSDRGGYSRGPLAALGVSWPLVHGWKRALIGRQVPEETLERAFAIRDGWIEPGCPRRKKRRRKKSMTVA
jgi:hypothetical protein